MSQHMDALGRANDTRLHRAEVLGAVRSGEKWAADVLFDDDWRLEGVKLYKLVSVIHRVGEKTAKRHLLGYHLSETITLGQLSPSTRTRLAVDLRALQEARQANRGARALVAA